MLGKGKLDISAARQPLDGSHHEAIVDGQPGKVFTTAQILYGKLDRGTDALPRDALDFATSAETDPGELAEAWNLFTRTRQEAIIRALESTAQRNAAAFATEIDGVPPRFQLPPGELNTRAIAALDNATYTRVVIETSTERTIIHRETRAGQLEPEIHETTDVSRVLKFTGIGEYVANLGDVEVVNLVYMAGLIHDARAAGVVYDTTDADRVQRLISAPDKYPRP